uniref:Coronin n=2 Tax=Laurasiatheria TaxID=314145 RepID=A0A8D1K6X0_PIG
MLVGGRVAHRGGHLPPGPLIVRRILSLGEHPASSVCTSHTKSSKVSDMQEAAQTCCWVDGLLCHMARPLGVRGPAILSARYFTESRTRVNALMPLAALLGFAERVVLPAQGQALNSWRPLSRFLHAAGGHWALLTHPPHPWRPASLLRVLSPALQEAVAGLTLVSPGPSQMSWRPQYRSSKFRNVYGKVANREHCFDGIPITKNVHDNHFCAVNARFLAIVTESAGGGSFLVIPLEQTGRIEPNYPKVCGHQGNVLDIKWNPFIDNIIASCSEDTSVRIWEIPEGGLKRNMTEALLELHGHSRRVGLVEWHPTTNNILFSAGYDYKVLIWNLDVGEPVKMIDCHSDVILCMSFNTDGSLLTTTCKDKKLRVIEPRSGRVLQEDLSMPLIEEEIDGLSGLLFPFYDADTHMLYLAGKGDGNIRYYEISTEKPYLSYLMEFRSPAPQKGLGVMPKHGLDVSACEVFRFYKLVTLKGLIEPISMIVPRRSDSYQEDIYPMTPGTEPALTPDEWLGGINRDPVLMSLKEGYKKSSKMVFKAPIKEKKSVVVNGIDLLENVPPRTENELLRMFFRQQDEIRRLKEELAQKDIRIRQLQLELKNLRNSPKNC